MSTFCVLQTAVTSVPNDLASCTANDPTPPDDPVNQDLLPRLNLSFVAKTLQSGDRRYRDGGGLKRETGRFQDQFVFISTRILGKRTLVYPEHLIPWLELLDGCANGLHLSAMSTPRTVLMALRSTPSMKRPTSDVDVKRRKSSALADAA